MAVDSRSGLLRYSAPQFHFYILALSIIPLITTSCSNSTRYEPSPDELIELLMAFPPVIVPPTTSANQSTQELAKAIEMGQGSIDYGMLGFRSFISRVRSTETIPLVGKNGFRWIRDPGKATSIDLSVWIEKGVRFEMDYDLTIPSHFYITEGYFTPSLSDGEMQHQTMTMEWSTAAEGLSLKIDTALGIFAAFDSTHGGGWLRWNSKGGMNGHGANWDAEGNITIRSWINSGL